MSRKFKNPRKNSPKIEKEVLGMCQHVLSGATFGPNCEDPEELPETCDKPAYDRHGSRVYCKKHIKIKIHGAIDEYGGDEPAGEYDSPEEVSFDIEIEAEETDEFNR